MPFCISLIFSLQFLLSKPIMFLTKISKNTTYFSEIISFYGLCPDKRRMSFFGTDYTYLFYLEYVCTSLAVSIFFHLDKIELLLEILMHSLPVEGSLAVHHEALFYT